MERATEEDKARVVDVLQALQAVDAAKQQERSKSEALSRSPVPESVSELSATSKNRLGSRRPPMPSPRAGGEGMSGEMSAAVLVLILFACTKSYYGLTMNVHGGDSLKDCFIRR